MTVIICAAGKGERTGFNENKILRELNGLPVLSYSLSAFAPFVDEILVTVTEKDEERINALLSPFPNARIVRGGNTRSESVYHALKEARSDIVLVHDAARPFVTEQIIRDCIDSVKNYGSGVCALPATDTVVFTRANQILSVPDRGTIYTVQTPQGFYTADIKQAYACSGGADYTDDSAVYGAFIAKPHLTRGDIKNKKLTYKQDFDIPPVRLPSVGGAAVGFGVDVHAFCAGVFVTLGGVKIDCDRALAAHSDGDVVIHAVMDALLSAAGLDDIGHYFPDTDPEYDGADSMRLLERVVREIKKRGFKPANISVSVQAEKPRLAPHIDAMTDNISRAARLSPQNIAVAAGTCEGLGFVGEGLGIAAYCICTLDNI